ncbi:LacI family DNA-binding transcriptional regulator [Deinococcus roseus]|uniref:Transcriptional regulator n=1 Tax=Deinococcus roseus TaxID=392414 RepID=A0ABQ2D2C1_9DEIO|nr:LacI family DNA-binding transcriptional regulator [Deinococcus roseus]GGJ42939.1 transcriptional regulator [Deinococcus roseus]
MTREAPTPRRRATLKDVAAALGVSPATISNAYNRPHHLSADLRERVFQMAQQLGYPGPHPTARSLRIQQAGALGVLYPERLFQAFSDPFSTEFLRGITAATEGAGLGLLLVPASSSSHPAVSTVQGANVDGLVLYSLADNDPRMQAALVRQVPMVLVDQPRLEGFPFVGIEDQHGAEMAARHLIDLGHHKVGIVSLKFSPESFDILITANHPPTCHYRVSSSRLEGYLEGLQLPAEHLPVFICEHNSLQNGALAATQLLDAHPDLTAILTMSDQLAFGVMEAARNRGLNIPEDLSVVGYDDGASALQAGLTTIHQPSETKGRLAGEALIQLLQGQVPAAEQILPTRLVVRGTTRNF